MVRSPGSPPAGRDEVRVADFSAGRRPGQPPGRPGTAGRPSLWPPGRTRGMPPGTSTTAHSTPAAIEPLGVVQVLVVEEVECPHPDPRRGEPGQVVAPGRCCQAGDPGRARCQAGVGLPAEAVGLVVPQSEVAFVDPGAAAGAVVEHRVGEELKSELHLATILWPGWPAPPPARRPHWPRPPPGVWRRRRADRPTRPGRRGSRRAGPGTGPPAPTGSRPRPPRSRARRRSGDRGRRLGPPSR